MGHTDERPAGHIHSTKETISRYVYDTGLQRVLWRKGDRMDEKIELAPVLRDSFKYRFHLSRRIYVQRHQNRGFELKRERSHIFLCFFVEIGHRELCSERSESLRAAPGDRIFIGNADHKASFAF